MYFRYFVISPWKRIGPSFEQTLIPFTKGYFEQSFDEIGPVLHLNNLTFTQGCFVPSLVEIGPAAVLEKKMNMWKVYDNDNVDDRQRTNFDQKNSLEPSAEVS